MSEIANEQKELYLKQLKAFNKAVENEAINGNIIISKNDEELVAIVLEKGKPINHIMHGILTLLTGLFWGIAWLIISCNPDPDKTFKICYNGNDIPSKLRVK